MAEIVIPAKEAEDWRAHLSDPEKHWRSGYSAKTLAHCWQDSDGFPDEFTKVFENAGKPFSELVPLMILPEHKVALPGGSTASQSDIWILAKVERELFSITVEGKVSEPFGETVEDWLRKDSKGRQTRLTFLIETLGIPESFDKSTRYQLFHRTASAVLEADRFLASQAMMVVHSFSHTNEWYDDFEKFAGLFGIKTEINRIFTTKVPNGMPLHLAWIHGNETYLNR